MFEHLFESVNQPPRLCGQTTPATAESRILTGEATTGRSGDR
jgi:hypothetical protein